MEASAGKRRALEPQRFCTGRSRRRYQTFFLSATNDYLARDSAGFFAGDVVQIADQYGTTVTAAATVASVGTNTITLTATPASAPTSGDIVRVTSYASAVSAQRGRWAFVADASDEVDGDPDNAYTYPVG